MRTSKTHGTLTPIKPKKFATVYETCAQKKLTGMKVFCESN